MGDTIAAPATGAGVAAIAVIRLSGPAAARIASQFAHTRDNRRISIENMKANTVRFAVWRSSEEAVDEVVITRFRAPHSYTGEDVIEISIHGSPYIRERVLHDLLAAGARAAEPGEFTLRAFLNGKLDLSQAEAVADLIESGNAASHAAAMKQLRGGFSKRIGELRRQLVSFASLVELELDFSEEDVEFADRGRLQQLLDDIMNALRELLSGFSSGNALKRGFPVVIAGRPNAGKSTLLNALMNDERAIVSDIPGTTRDAIEDALTINGILFRITDTAGLRDTTDAIESIGVQRAREAVAKAAVVLYVYDSSALGLPQVKEEIAQLQEGTEAKIITVANKSDLARSSDEGVIPISAKEGRNIEALRAAMVEAATGGVDVAGGVLVTNARHAAALRRALASVEQVSVALKSGLPGDLLAVDIRAALEELGHITGEVTSDDLLENIFRNFCIGK